jgi:vacuolar-type H+-ATPase subunit H
MSDVPEDRADVDLPDSAGVIELLDGLIHGVESAKSVPLSDQVRLDREAMIQALEQIKLELPEELRTARWMIRERETFIARTQEKAQQIRRAASEQARELVSDSHILAEAVEEANTLVRHAEGDARRIRLEAEDDAEERLQNLEILFANLLKQIREARAEFHRVRPAPPEVPE